MRMSCKYYYRGGLCANSQMEKPFCVGEENCEYMLNKSSGSMEEPEISEKKPVQSDMELSKVIVQEGDDTMSQWRGVYCPHYKRFFCTGEEGGCKTGCCKTAEDYHNALSEHVEKYK